MRRLLFLVWKELLELRQDRRMLAIVFIAPVLQLVILGNAATTDVRHVPVVVVDEDRSIASRTLIERFRGSPYFTLVDVLASDRPVARMFETGHAWLALSIPTGFGRDVAAGVPTSVQVIGDGTDANSTNIALGYAANLVSDYSREVGGAGLPPGVTAPSGLAVETRVWFNPQLESRFFMVPGILAILLIVMTVVLASMGIVREKELGTLEQLHVTPVRRWQLIVGKLVPYGLIGIVDILLVVAVAIAVFRVPLHGSFLLLFAMSCLFLLSTLGIGLFVSTVSENQQQAMMTAVFFFVTPMVFLSGFVFPVENMPATIRPLTAVIPLRYFLVIVRGIFLKGVGLETLWPQALVLLAWGVSILTLATIRSRKTAD